MEVNPFNKADIVSTPPEGGPAAGTPPSCQVRTAFVAHRCGRETKYTHANNIVCRPLSRLSPVCQPRGRVCTHISMCLSVVDIARCSLSPLSRERNNHRPNVCVCVCVQPLFLPALPPLANSNGTGHNFPFISPRCLRSPSSMSISLSVATTLQPWMLQHNLYWF